MRPNENPVGWFEIYVQDLDVATKFYQTVLNCEMTPMDVPEDDHGLKMVMFGKMDDASMTQPGASGALVKMDGCPSGGNSTLIYFNCDDCAQSESRVAASGGKVFKPKFSIGPYGFISLGIDPDGNMFGLHSLV